MSLYSSEQSEIIVKPRTEYKNDDASIGFA